MISKFRGKYMFLSNFYEGEIFYYNQIPFTNVEAAFQSQKDLSKQNEFSMLNPSDSKRKGRKVNLRSDWEEVKEKIMYDILYEKFTQDMNLKQKLLNTQEHVLVEGNYWHDNYWGTCLCDKCKTKDKKNNLGKLLMQLREELRYWK